MKKRSPVHLCSIVLIAAVFTVWAQTPVERHGKLRTDGKYLLNEHGKIVQLRGMSFHWSNPAWPGYQWYNASTVNTLADDWNCSVVRAAYDPTSGGTEGVDAVINAAIDKGIYVIIDWHSHDAEQNQSQAISYFTDAAQKYKDTPNVIFEIYNEPITSGSADPEDGSANNAVKTWAAIKPYMEAVTSAIRNAGAENLVIIGTPYYAQHVGVAAADPVDFDNVAYAFHFYSASHGPEAHYVKTGEQSGLENNYLEAGLGRVPVFVTEWGTSHSNGGQDGKTYVDEENTDWWFERYINGDYHLSWANWSVSSQGDFGQGQTSAALNGSLSSPSPSGQIVKRLLNESTDTWDHPSESGSEGPAKDSVFAMPGTHPTHRYNQYFGSYTQVKRVPYSDRDDKENVRTAENNCLRIREGGSDEWVSYNVDNANSTKNMILRYMAPEGSGTVQILVDGSSAGEIDLQQTDSWLSVITPVDVPAGSHTVKLQFVNTTGFYDIEWFELTNSDDLVSSVVHQTKASSKLNVTVRKNSIALTMPSSHDFTTYDLIGVDGRVVRSGSVEGISHLSLSDMAKGVWFIKLKGAARVKTIRAVISGK